MQSRPYFSRMRVASASLLVAFLVACGGGPSADISRVVVVGDSLSDVGTFGGMKFTIQNANNPAVGYPVWTQLIENALGLDGSTQCNHYAWDQANSNTPTFAVASQSCTNYAIGGGRIHVPGQAANERNVAVQLSKHVSTGDFTTNDLLLIDGGGNDLADLVGLYLGATNEAGQTAFAGFITRLVDATTVGTLMATPNTGPVLAAGAYMKALASEYYQSISTLALAKGAERVLILNVPDITLTPRFQAVLYGVTQQLGAPAAVQIKAAIQGWAQAFNAELAALAADESRVAIADFYTDFSNQIANPSSYGLTNATDAACPIVGTDSQGLPQYDFPTCVDALLDSDTSNDRTSGWWKTYAFSDGFHPTPKGHESLAALVSRTLSSAGWL
jgi:outer membrane lipase/esterase